MKFLDIFHWNNEASAVYLCSTEKHKHVHDSDQHSVYCCLNIHEVKQQSVSVGNSRGQGRLNFRPDLTVYFPQKETFHPKLGNYLKEGI